MVTSDSLLQPCLPYNSRTSKSARLKYCLAKPFSIAGTQDMGNWQKVELNMTNLATVFSPTSKLDPEQDLTHKLLPICRYVPPYIKLLHCAAWSGTETDKLCRSGRLPLLPGGCHLSAQGAPWSKPSAQSVPPFTSASRWPFAARGTSPC